jgi:hypothetical protein
LSGPRVIAAVIASSLLRPSSRLTSIGTSKDG